MKAENKKYLVYGGLALLIGGVIYVSYSFIFPKKVILNEPENPVKEEEVVNAEKSNPFRDLLNNSNLPSSIKAPVFQIDKKLLYGL